MGGGAGQGTKSLNALQHSKPQVPHRYTVAMPVHCPPKCHSHSTLGHRLALCLTLALPALACAQEREGAGLPLWEVGVIGGVLSTPAYPASNQRNQRALALPFVVYRGEVLRADRNGVGARLLHTDRVEFDIGFAASLPASSSRRLRPMVPP